MLLACQRMVGNTASYRSFLGAAAHAAPFSANHSPHAAICSSLMLLCVTRAVIFRGCRFAAFDAQTKLVPDYLSSAAKDCHQTNSSVTLVET
jgi:hypothetical protein